MSQPTTTPTPSSEPNSANDAANSGDTTVADAAEADTGVQQSPGVSATELTPDERRTRRKIILSFWLVILAGLPMWWRTTEVYRAELPFAEIEEWGRWDASDLAFPKHFVLHVAMNATDPPLAATPDALAFEIRSAVEESFAASGKVNQSTSARSSSKNQLSPKKLASILRFPVSVDGSKWSDWQTAKDVESYCPPESDQSTNGQYALYVMPASGSGWSRPSKANVLLCNDRSAVVRVHEWKADVVKRVLTRTIVKLFDDEHAAMRRFVREKQSSEPTVDPDSMRTTPYAPAYQITFSLLNGDPSTLHVDWDVRAAIAYHMRPFLNALSSVYNFTIDSQVQHYATLAFEPESNTKARWRDQYYYLTAENLPHFINSAEWNLASAVSNDPSLNFILYVPTASQRPLKIHDAKGKPTTNNAFLLPRWGGVVISNPNTDSGNQFGYALEDLKPVMEIFVAQLRALLGIRELLGENVKVGDDIQVQHAPAPPTAVTAWELDALTRRRIAESVITSVATLRSLALLISEIPSMVVLDHIQTEVTEALECLRKSTAELRNRKYAEALQHARHALLLSETAFFDPTMVSMLYFPDEHKYAIYMPLFVPISVPLMAALVREIKEFKRLMRR